MATTHDIETIVIGAGVVGLAIASALAENGHEVLILEQHVAFGTETSARNSEVIHAGIYYSQNSLKAKLCTRGKALLYAYCDQHGVAYKRLGKLIVATSDEQVSTLDTIAAKASANGVNDLSLLKANEIHELEPAIKAQAALLSPSTGIVDSHGLMLSLIGKAESLGAMIAYGSVVKKVESVNGGFALNIVGDEEVNITAKNVINAAGHGAINIAQQTVGLNQSLVPQASYAKGNYFRLKGRTPVSRLIYPIPEPGGLGVHITIDLAGQCRFGPDVQWQDSLEYEVDPARADSFCEAIRRYWPALEDDALVPDYAGVRPKITFHGAAYTDFMIQTSAEHGMHGLVNLFGFESPGLTSCLAIAELVAATFDP